MTPKLLSEIEAISNSYKHLLHSFWPFPLPLFVELARINSLRARSYGCQSKGSKALTLEAWEVLGRIDAFQPDTWAKKRPAQAAWVLLARLTQAAATIYCISSLQSVGALPLNHLLEVKRSENRQLLYNLLKNALPLPYFGGQLIWPVLVLGVDAVNTGVEIRAFVMKSLPQMSYREGSNVSRTAKGIIERFWASGGTSWDACFDKPYLLPAQWSVRRQHSK